MEKNKNLTQGPVTKSMLLFAVPMVLGNLLQQLYNVVDTLIVGKCLGADALAAVGASFALMTFLTSIMLGLCMGSGAVFSMLFGAQKEERMKQSFVASFVLIGGLTLAINILVLVCTTPILKMLQIPADILADTESYLRVIMYGFGFTFVYNYFAALMRAVGNSVVPLVFLGCSAVLNIGLDLLFIVNFGMGVEGAAWATIIAQGVSALGIFLYCLKCVPMCRIQKKHLRMEKNLVQEIAQYSVLTCVQQSIMNFGILMIQGLVNSFGVTVMAAFAAAVKIDSFAYMPVQDFGNAFSTFIAQNYGAGKKERIHEGIHSAIKTAMIFCVIISAGVFMFAENLMQVFVNENQTEIIRIGVQYLRIEGACYCGIGCLFLLYGLYRGIGKPGISVVLTVISLGTRVLLAYILAPIEAVGLVGIWIAIPIGWILADAAGLGYWMRIRRFL